MDDQPLHSGHLGRCRYLCRRHGRRLRPRYLILLDPFFLYGSHRLAWPLCHPQGPADRCFDPATAHRQALWHQTQAGDVDIGVHRGYGCDCRNHPCQRDPDYFLSGYWLCSGADDGPGGHDRLCLAGWSVGGALDRLHPGRDADGDGHFDLRHRSDKAGWMDRVRGAASRRDGLSHRDA